MLNGAQYTGAVKRRGTIPNAFNLVAVQTTGNVAANGFNDDRNFTHYAGNGGIRRSRARC